MYRDKERYGQDGGVVRLSAQSTFSKPLSWKAPALVFTCSWSDFFIEEADEWRRNAWQIIKRTPHLTYQILTKRPERIAECLPPDWGNGYANVWLGVSVENQRLFEERALILAGIKAKLRFLSCEPLIQQLRLKEIQFEVLNAIGWVIIGGESGNDFGPWKYRPSQLLWFESIVEDCKSFGVPVFVKQLGTHLAKELLLRDRTGGDINELPESVAVREMPECYTPPSTILNNGQINLFD